MAADLIGRLEAATGPDRELDWRIADALGEVPEHVIQGPAVTPCGWFRREDQWSLTRTKESDVYAGVESWSPKPRTTSIDAALTLVPEGWAWDVSTKPDGHGGVVYLHSPDRTKWRDTGGFAATPALAICIAALKARA